MRKYSMVLAALVVAGLAATVMAQAPAGTTILSFDIRDNVGSGQSIAVPTAPFTVGQGLNFPGNTWPNDGAAGGGKGNGQILRLNPVLSNGHQAGNTGSPNFGLSWPDFDGDHNTATGDLNLFAEVGADLAGHTQGVLSSLGADIGISAPGNKYNIAATAWAWTLTDPSSPVNYGFAAGTASGTNGNTGVTGAKYVKVPVDGSSMYATAGGLIAGSFTKLGRLKVTAGTRGSGTSSCTPATGANGHAAQSTFSVTMSVNNLLITRTYSTGAAADEQVSFGYGSPAGLPDTAVNGSTVGGAGYRDAVIQIRMKGDFNGDGVATGADISSFTPLVNQPATSITQTQKYLGDFNGAPGVPISGPDISFFNALVATGGAGTCP